MLAGAISGRQVLAALLAHIGGDPTAPETLLLDFSRVEVATASFLRESVLALRDIVRGRRSNFYPVISNANQSIREELAEVLRPRGDVMIVCTLGESGSVIDSALIGELDPKQKVTLDLVRQHGETDAAELMRIYGAQEGVKQTAWNNRLAALAGLGLAMEVSHGRIKRYKPIFGGS